MTRRRAWRTLLFAVSLVAAANTDSRAEPLVVPMRRGDVGTERAFLEELLVQARKDCPGRELTLDRFQVGRVDLNDDDQYELIVSIFDSCFGGSCYHATPVYQFHNGKWVQIDDLNGANADIDAIAHLLTDEPDMPWPREYVIVLDETIGGWRTVLAGEEASRWSNLGIGELGGDYNRPARPGYVTYCITERCRVCHDASLDGLQRELPYDHSGER